MKSKSLLVVSHGKYVPHHDLRIVYSADQIDAKRIDAIKSLLSGRRDEYKISTQKRDIVVRVYCVTGHFRMTIDDFNDI